MIYVVRDPIERIRSTTSIACCRAEREPLGRAVLSPDRKTRVFDHTWSMDEPSTSPARHAVGPASIVDRGGVDAYVSGTARFTEPNPAAAR